MPGRWFWPHVQMLSRLAAEEALGRRSEIAAGTGAMPEADRRTYLADLHRASEVSRRPEKPSLLSMAQLGITVNEGQEVSEDG